MDLNGKKALINSYIAAYNNFDVEGMLENLSEDIKFENIQSGEINASAYGKDEFRKLAEQAKSLFSERKQTIENMIDDLGKLSVDITYFGILAVDMPNGMSEGDKINLKGISEFTFSNSQISSIRDIS